MQELLRAIRIGDPEEIKEMAHKEIEKIYKNTETISQHNLATLEIVSRFVRFCTNNALDFNEISEFRKIV